MKLLRGLKEFMACVRSMRRCCVEICLTTPGTKYSEQAKIQQLIIQIDHSLTKIDESLTEEYFKMQILEFEKTILTDLKNFFLSDSAALIDERCKRILEEIEKATETLRNASDDRKLNRYQNAYQNIQKIMDDKRTAELESGIKRLFLIFLPKNADKSMINNFYKPSLNSNLRCVTAFFTLSSSITTVLMIKENMLAPQQESATGPHKAATLPQRVLNKIAQPAKDRSLAYPNDRKLEEINEKVQKANKDLEEIKNASKQSTNDINTMRNEITNLKTENDALKVKLDQALLELERVHQSFEEQKTEIEQIKKLNVQTENRENNPNTNMENNANEVELQNTHNPPQRQTQEDGILISKNSLYLSWSIAVLALSAAVFLAFKK